MVEVLERGGAGLNLTAEVRDGILNHTGPGTPATLEGRIVRLVDRFAYVNHDIDDAARAGILDPADAAGRADRAARAPPRRSGSTRSCTTWSRRRTGPATSCRSPPYDDALLELRSYMFEHVYLGAPARAESARAAAMVEALFAHHLAARRRAVGHRLGRRHDRRLRPARARRAARGRARSCVSRISDAVARGGQGGRRHGRPRRRPHRAAQGRQPLHRANARSTTTAARRSRSILSTSSTTASAAVAAATRSGFAQETEDLDFVGAVEWLADRYGVELVYEEMLAPGRAPPRRAAAPAARCSTTPPCSTPATCGSRPRPSRRAPTWPSAGCEDQTAHDFRLGFAPTAWDRVCAAALAKGFSPGRARAGGALEPRPARPGRPLPRPADVPARRRPRPRARLRCPADARRRAAQVPELARGHAVSQVRGRVRARSRPHDDRRELPGDRGGGLHGRARAAPGRARPSRSPRWAPRSPSSRCASSAAWPAPARSTWPSTPTRPARRRPCAGWSSPRPPGMQVRVVELPEGRDPADVAVADPAAFRAALDGGRRCPRVSVSAEF